MSRRRLQSMRIVYFSRDYTTHDWRYLDALARTPHDVWYLRLAKGPVELERREVPPGIRLVSWPGGRKPVRGLLSQLRLLSGVRRVFRDIKPDLVHAGPVQSCGLLSAVAGFHPLLVMSWGSDVLVDADRSWLSRLVTRFTLRRADLVVGDCRAVRERVRELADYPDDRIVTYPWGIDLDVFHPRPSALSLRTELGWRDNPVILSTRSWEPLYGIDVILAAFAETVRRVPDARLILVGDGGLAPSVRTFIRDNGLAPFVHLAGQVSHDLLVEYFNLADVYVSASYADGTSISLLEAMACALPVVVSDIPGNREWVTPRRNGWLVPAGNASALGTALAEAVASAEQRRSMGAANHAVARERADWGRNFRQLLAAYDRLQAAPRREPVHA